MNMQWKRLVYYLLINIFISAITTLVVLNIWDRAHRTETASVEPVALLPGVATPPAMPAEATPEPTIPLQAYQIGPGETLGEVALAFNISVDELLEINGLMDPDSIGAGEVIFVPDLGSATTAEPLTAVSEGEANPQVAAPPVGQVEVVAVFGAGDLASERVQLRGTGEGSISLTGWRLRDEEDHVYIFPQITLFGNGAVDIYTAAGVDTVVALHWGTSEAVWQSGETATLFDDAGNVQATYVVP